MKNLILTFAISTALSVSAQDTGIVYANDDKRAEIILNDLHSCVNIQHLEELHAFIITTVDYPELERTCHSNGYKLFQDEKVEYSYNLIPNDAEFPLQWHLRQTNDKDIDAEIAWDSLSGNAWTTVAVFDGGFDPNHPDLVGNWDTPYNAVANNADCSFVNQFDRHGISCGGVIAAVMNNGIGVAGVGGNRVKYMPVKIMSTVSSSGTFSTSASIQVAAINAVLANPNAVAVSMSYGGGNYLASFQEAINIASTTGRNGKGILFFASTGNNYNNTSVNYPAAYNNVIGVGATTSIDTRASFSTWSQTCDISAPGQTIRTLDRVGSDGYSTSSDYASVSGTSFSCPLTAGVAGLVAYKNNTLTAQQIFQVLASTADKVGGYTYANDAAYPLSSRCAELGYGRINAAMAMAIAGSGDTITPPAPKHNLTVDNCNAVTTVIPGQQLTISCDQSTDSPGLDSVSSVVRFLWSTDLVASADDITLGLDTAVMGNGISAGYHAITITVPTGFGTRYVIIQSDWNNAVAESYEADNACSITMTVNNPVLLALDATIEFTTSPITTCSSNATIMWKFKNVGTSPITSITYSRRWQVCPTPGSGAAPWYVCVQVATWNGSIAPGATMSGSIGVSSTMYFTGVNYYQVSIVAVNGLNGDGNTSNNTNSLYVNRISCTLQETEVYTLSGLPVTKVKPAKEIPYDDNSKVPADDLRLEHGMYIIHERYQDGTVLVKKVAL